MLNKVTRAIYSIYLKNIISYMFIFPMIHFARNVKWIDCCSVTKSCPTLCDPMDCTTPGFQSFTVSQSLLRFMSIESVMLYSNLILYCPHLLLPSIFPIISVDKLALHIKWPEYWSFILSISSLGDQCIGSSVTASVLPMNIQDGFPLGWTGFNLLAFHGTLKSLLKNHSSKLSIHQGS